jgi:hypothetical protein
MEIVMSCDLVPQISVGSHVAANVGKNGSQAGTAGGAIGCDLISQPFKTKIQVPAPTLSCRVEEAKDRQDNVTSKKVLINAKRHATEPVQQGDPLRGSSEELPIHHPRQVDILNLLPQGSE